MSNKNNILLSIADHLTAISLVLLTIAGPLRVLYSLDYKIYYVSITLLTMFAIVKFYSGPKINKYIAIYILLSWFFFLWLILSIIWSSSPTKWNSELPLVGSLLLIVTTTGFIVKRSTIQRFIIYLILGTFLVTLFVFKETSNIQNMRGYNTQVTEAYLTLALPQGMALIVSIFHFFNTSAKIKFFWFVSSINFMIGLGLSLARGSLIFSVFAISVVSLIYLMNYQGSWNQKIKEYGKYVFAVVFFLGGLLIIAFNVERTANRLIRLLDISAEALAGGRGNLWVSAWQGIGDAPIIGHGLGMNRVIVGNYPHNLVLQIWLDGGLIAVFILIMLIMMPIIFLFKKSKYHYNDPIILSLFSIIIALTLEFSKSFDFYSSRSLIIVLTLGLCYASSLDLDFRDNGSGKQ